MTGTISIIGKRTTLYLRKPKVVGSAGLENNSDSTDTAASGSKVAPSNREQTMATSISQVRLDPLRLCSSLLLTLIKVNSSNFNNDRYYRCSTDSRANSGDN
jgi:hypothetical protein